MRRLTPKRERELPGLEPGTYGFTVVIDMFTGERVA